MAAKYTKFDGHDYFVAYFITRIWDAFLLLCAM